MWEDVAKRVNMFTKASDINFLNKRTCLKTGIDSLDSRFLVKKGVSELITVVALPGVGKSMFLGQLALGISQHSNVLLFSLEMSKEEICARLVSNVTKTPQFKLNQLTQENIVEARNKISRIKINDDAGLHINELINMCLIENKTNKIEAILVDYIQIISSNIKRSRTEELFTVVNGLKNLSKDLSIPVIALAQMAPVYESRMRGTSKDSSKKNYTPFLSEIAETSAASKESDRVIFMIRPSFYDPNEDKQEVRFFVKKDRSGVICDFSLKFDSSTLTYSDYDKGGI